MCSMHFFNFCNSLMRQVHLSYPHGRWFLIIYVTHAVFLHMYLWLLSPTLSTYSFCTLYWERFLVNLNMILLCLLLLFQSLHAGLLHKLLLSLNPDYRDPYGRYQWICSFIYLFFTCSPRIELLCIRQWKFRNKKYGSGQPGFSIIIGSQCHDGWSDWNLLGQRLQRILYLYLGQPREATEDFYRSSRI